MFWSQCSGNVSIKPHEPSSHPFLRSNPRGLEVVSVGEPGNLPPVFLGSIRNEKKSWWFAENELVHIKFILILTKMGWLNDLNPCQRWRTLWFCCQDFWCCFNWVILLWFIITHIYHIIYVIISLHEIRYYCVFGYYYCCIYIRTYICKTYTCNYNTMCCIYMICKLTYIYNCICVDIVVSYTYNVLQPSLRLPGDGVFSTPTRVVLTIQFPLGWKLKMVVPSRSNSLVGGFKYFF